MRENERAGTSVPDTMAPVSKRKEPTTTTTSQHPHHQPHTIVKSTVKSGAPNTLLTVCIGKWIPK
jgi:hypothetical protein